MFTAICTLAIIFGSLYAGACVLEKMAEKQNNDNAMEVEKDLMKEECCGHHHDADGDPKCECGGNCKCKKDNE